MTHSQFWHMIDESLALSAGDPDPDRQCQALISALAALSCEEIAEFHNKFQSFSKLADDVANAPGALGTVYEYLGPGEHWGDWTAWLISRGQETFFTALAASKFSDYDKVADQSFEMFAYAASESLDGKEGYGDEPSEYLDAYLYERGVYRDSVELMATAG